MIAALRAAPGSTTASVAEGPSASLLEGAPASFCPACGARLPAGDRYCRNCGDFLGRRPPPARSDRAENSRSAKAAGKRASTVILIGGMIGLAVGRLLDRRRR